MGNIPPKNNGYAGLETKKPKHGAAPHIADLIETHQLETLPSVRQILSQANKDWNLADPSRIFFCDHEKALIALAKAPEAGTAAVLHDLMLVYPGPNLDGMPAKWIVTRDDVIIGDVDLADISQSQHRLHTQLVIWQNKEIKAPRK